MAYLVRCPYSLCGRLKRIDPRPGSHSYGPPHRCPDCGVAFFACPPQPGERYGWATEDW